VARKGKLFDAIVGIPQLSDLFGVSRQAIHSWWTTPGGPDPARAGRRRWSLASVIRWRISRARSTPTDLDDELTTARIELTNVRREIESLKLAKSTEQVVPRARYESDLKAVRVWFCEAGDTCGGELCASLVGKSATEIRAALDTWWLNCQRALKREALGGGE